MPELPDRPHLDQVRYQARELQRAAAAGDNAARRQIHSVAARRVTLASAQLAVARQYGFASWPQLTAEVARRRAAIDDPGPAPAAAPLPPLLAAWYELDSAGRDLVAAQYADRPDCGPSSTRCSRTRRGPARTAAHPRRVARRRGGAGPATVEARATGPYVRGARTDRNIGLAWGDVPGDGTLRLFRGAKLRLADVDPALIEEALRPGCRLIARARLTDATGNPICARLRPPDIEWCTS